MLLIPTSQKEVIYIAACMKTYLHYPALIAPLARTAFKHIIVKKEWRVIKSM